MGMFFRKVYKSIEDAAHDLVCPEKLDKKVCFSCPLAGWNNGEGCGCHIYMRRHPVKVAKMLGLEIVREEGD